MPLNSMACYNMLIGMDTIALSPKFQMAVPQAVREFLKLIPGQKFQVFASGNWIEIFPMKPMKEMRGFLKGMNRDLKNEPDSLPKARTPVSFPAESNGDAGRALRWT